MALDRRSKTITFIRSGGVAALIAAVALGSLGIARAQTRYLNNEVSVAEQQRLIDRFERLFKEAQSDRLRGVCENYSYGHPGGSRLLGLEDEINGAARRGFIPPKLRDELIRRLDEEEAHPCPPLDFKRPPTISITPTQPTDQIAGADCPPTQAQSQPSPFPPVDVGPPSVSTVSESAVEMGPPRPPAPPPEEPEGESILDEITPVRVIASAPQPPLDHASATLLALHNQTRAQFGSLPLKWDPQLASQAASYGPQLAKHGRPVHSSRVGRETSRENLQQALPGTTPEKMVGVWIAERRHFMPGTFPNVSRTGNWLDVGHYTQMVWPTTINVGCAIHRGGPSDWLICRYSPPGNQDGKPVLASRASYCPPANIPAAQSRR